MDKAKLKDNAQDTFSNFLSISRNTYITSSIGIGVLTYSKNLKKKKIPLTFLAIMVIIYTIL